MESGNPAQAFVDEEISERVRDVFSSLLRCAYAAADEAMEIVPFLQTPGGRSQRGDLIMLATSYELQKHIAAGDLPFDGRWEDYARPTGQHFVLYSARARLTASQVEDPTKKPRRAVFRENYAENNQLELFDLGDGGSAGDRRLLHLLHGYQMLTFAHLAYPHPVQNSHVYRSPNVLRAAGSAPSLPLPPPEGPTDSPDPEIIERLIHKYRDHE